MQACVTIHGCKIAYVHIQLNAFEISVSLKISGGDDPPTDPEWGDVNPPVSPLEEILSLDFIDLAGIRRRWQATHTYPISGPIAKTLYVPVDLHGRMILSRSHSVFDRPS